jgi:hypothetical protein
MKINTDFIKSRIIELKSSEAELIKEMLDGYTKSHTYKLSKIKDQILINQKLILTLHGGEEEYLLEN